MKHETFNFLNFLNLLLQNWWNDWKQAAHNGVFFKEFGSIFMFRLMQFWGTYRGYKQSYLLDNAVRERFYYPKGYIQKDKKETDSDRRIDYSKID